MSWMEPSSSSNISCIYLAITWTAACLVILFPKHSCPCKLCLCFQGHAKIVIIQGLVLSTGDIVDVASRSHDQIAAPGYKAAKAQSSQAVDNIVTSGEIDRCPIPCIKKCQGRPKARELRSRVLSTCTPLSKEIGMLQKLSVYCPRFAPHNMEICIAELLCPR